MITHRDDVPWTAREHGERYPDARRISFRGLGVVVRVEALDDRDGEG